MGQIQRLEIGFVLRQIHADAADDAARHPGAVGNALAQNAHQLFAVQQKIIRPFHAGIAPKAGFHGCPHRHAAEQGQGGGLHQRALDHQRVIQALPGSVYPIAPKAAPAGGLVIGTHHRAVGKLGKMLFAIGVGAAHLGQPDQILHFVFHCVQPLSAAGTRHS